MSLDRVGKHQDAGRDKQHQHEDDQRNTPAGKEQRHRAVGNQRRHEIIHRPSHAGPEVRQAHTGSELQKTGGKKHDKKSGGHIGDRYSGQEWPAPPENNHTQHREHHHAVHHQRHIFSFPDIKEETGSQAAQGQQHTGPLPDVHRARRMAQGDRVIQCAEYAGHQGHQKYQEQSRRYFLSGHFIGAERGSERRCFIRCECFFVDAACAHDQNTQYRKGNREYRGLRDLYIYQIVVCVL